MSQYAIKSEPFRPGDVIETGVVMIRRLAVVAALFASTAADAQTAAAPANGTLLAHAPCTFAAYDETSAFTRRYYSRTEYAETLAGAVDCFRIQYASDSLKVVGYLVKPRAAAAAYPVIVYNRGGFRDI